MWTAWPVSEKHLPSEGLFKEEKDEDDKFTFRSNEKKMPSSALEEELYATILRQAKDRFNKRNRPKQVRPSIESAAQTGDSNSDGSSNSSASSDESDAEPASQSEKMNLDQTATPAPTAESTIPTRHKVAKKYEPVVSANDELSNTILKPSVRHILSKLDTTLTILHNTRVAGLSYLSDSSETESESDATSPRKRGRGRPRLPPGQRGSSSGSEKGKTRGRPKVKHEPLKDESPHEMNLRLARKYHRRLPATEEEVKEAAFQEWLRQGDERISQQQSASRAASQDSETRDSDADDSAVDRKLQRWGLRDWSDVVGAAALAGFPREVIERTTQRCADLFGQGMAITHLDEVPVSRGPGFSTTTYRPERIRLSSAASDSLSSSEDEPCTPARALSASATLSQRRIASRQASLARSSREASSEQAPTPRGRRSRQNSGSASSPSRSRSRSRSSAGILFCPVSACKRAATGFSRRMNLRRHMRLVHPGLDENAADAGGEESDEEVMGAVHVDGFLRTVNPGKGWRGEDVVKRKRKWVGGHGTPAGSASSDEEVSE